jgi:hypothetical protein
MNTDCTFNTKKFYTISLIAKPKVKDANLTTEKNFLSPEQHLNILRDNAMFSESETAKRSAVDEMVETYGPKSLPILEEIVSTIGTPYDGFKIYCVEAMKKVLKYE